ncbi:MAG: hypothetical protein Q8O89_04145, partial [Nanoarchaeota archaeon]|nr:hypothetical protein [Nanoarchaeota archaeon]
IDDEIKIGLIQELLLRMLIKKSGNKRKIKNTTNMDIYNNFIKNLHITIPKTKVDPMLKESFDRVNEKYFLGFLDMPNLVWGGDNLRTLGTYNYQTDTLTISNIFKDENLRVIDYIMYHELLHKKHKFKSISGKNYAHTHQFRQREKEFENAEDMENLIKHIIRRKRAMISFGFDHTNNAEEKDIKEKDTKKKTEGQKKGFLGWFGI